VSFKVASTTDPDTDTALGGTSTRQEPLLLETFTLGFNEVKTSLEFADTSVKTPSSPSANTATLAKDPSDFKLSVGVTVMTVDLPPATLPIDSPLKTSNRSVVTEAMATDTFTTVCVAPCVSVITTTPLPRPYTVAPETVATLELLLTKMKKDVTSAFNISPDPANVRLDKTLITADS